MNIIIAVVLCVSLILGGVTVGLLINMSNKKKNYSECQGTIIRFYEEERPGSALKYISPVVEYEIYGIKYEIIGNYYSTSMKIGDKVTLLYSNDDFEKAVIKTGVFVGPIITGSLTVVAILALVLMLCLKGKGII